MESSDKRLKCNEVSVVCDECTILVHPLDVVHIGFVLKCGNMDHLFELQGVDKDTNKLELRYYLTNPTRAKQQDAIELPGNPGNHGFPIEYAHATAKVIC